MNVSLTRKSFIQRVALGTAALSVGGLPTLVSGCGGGKKDGDNAGLPLLDEGCVNAASLGASGGRAANRYSVKGLYASHRAGSDAAIYLLTDNLYPSISYLNNNGVAAGTDTNWRAVVWRDDQIAVLENSQAFSENPARDINDSGSVIGYGYRVAEGSDGARAAGFVRRQDGTVIVLGNLPDAGKVIPTAINNCGIIAGKALGSPVLWDSSDGRLLGRIAPSHFVTGECRINDRNEVAFFSNRPEPAQDTVILWHSGQATELGIPSDPSPGGFPVVEGVTGINNQGHILLRGGESRSSYLWRSDTRRFTNLGRAGFSRLNFDAAALNDSTIIVGTTDWSPAIYPGLSPTNPTGRNSTATLWQEGEFIDLNERIDPALNLQLYYGWDINNAGQILTYGQRTVGDERPLFVFLLTPEA